MTPAEIALILSAAVGLISGIGGLFISFITSRQSARKDELATLREAYEARIKLLEQELTELRDELAQKTRRIVELERELDTLTGKPRRKDTGEIKPIL